MTVSNASFRADFPEFSNAITFSDQQVNFWLNFVNIQLSSSPTDWGVWLDPATELLMAHNLAIEAVNMRAGANGIPGAIAGPVASKSVGGVSVSYSGAAVIEGAGDYNLTTYGLRFTRMASMVGSGGLQL